MTDLIHIQPTRAQRRAFAQWAVAQTPKLRTIGPNVFAVPAELFTQAPEEILIGSLVDGHRYVSPQEDAQEGRAAPGELLGVATPEGLAEPSTLEPRDAVPGEPLPEVPASAYGPDSVPLGVVGDEAESRDSRDQPAELAEVSGPFPCGLCERDYPTERGRDSHRRQKHPEA
ncbi:hypothetical protein J7E96_19405 [Streptomyces sp. ISL-96]|uniref:hypothetical protein n=1 Tax=Streptomyces sp. ISL-96 TaxID=2819191 RepID=UPI001BE57F80|nr:hypothetical protein [Streptomyces sp. ISL-96]MBT2490642.1 hypothetical protein [Streptomyces sp. ISL-96]